jgi:tetratricopeptide (TPR) repeat protein
LNSRSVNIFSLILALLLAGCSAQKNTGISRAYHNLTAKYNVLFNGSESFKEGLEKINLEFKDDYSEILPVFKYTGRDVASIVASDMDRTIKKCSKLITLHSITAKPKVRDSKTLSEDERAFFNRKEYNAFVDDAYLLMGKAHFYKKEFSLASEVFRKIINDFKNQPSVYESQLWLSRVAIENGKFIDASEILSTLNNNAEFPKKLLPDLFPTFAHYYLKQHDYTNAIAFLEKTLEVEKTKIDRLRFMFILAQLCEKTGDLKKASVYYAQVIKMNPVYEMAFNAHINRALAYEQGFGKADEIGKELEKMLHDDKNNEYQDQLYYALGNLAKKEGNEAKAVEYYAKSIEANQGNEQQLIRSYLTLADYYYSLPNYPNAQAYYDSAVSKLDVDYPGYNELYTKTNSLTHLVNEINAVKLGDSVLILAVLPKEELNTRIDALIADQRKQEEEARIREQEKQLDDQYGQEVAARNARQQSGTIAGAKWYFYNESAKALGYSEFKLKWGNRRLEDHWQRASKAMVSFAAGNEEEINTNAETAVEESNRMSRDFYLANIPFTDSAVTATKKSIETGLYNMGMIYKDDLKDLDKSSEAFKQLIKRFPSSSALLSAYYNLYLISKDQNNLALTDYYKNIIATQFPQSMYAKVLTDPEYFREIERQDQIVRDYYKQTYELYISGNYSEVSGRSQYAMLNYPSHELYPRFNYLKVLAEGRNSDRKIFRDSLMAITVKYPGTEIASDARNIVNYMDLEHPEIKLAEEIKISREMFAFSPVGKYYFVFAVDKRMNTNQLVFNIINYNLDYSDSLDLIVEIIDISNPQKLITVRTFKNKDQASNYLSAITVSEEIRKDMPELNLNPFIISEKNFYTLREQKALDLYLKFYNENY